MSYRKIWENTYGKIPNGYEIHHKDGNGKNNSIENLICVTPEEHYRIHYEQGDFMACKLIAARISVSNEEKNRIHKLAMQKRDQTGEKNPMFGRSAIKEKNMKWYTNGKFDKMFVENEEPEGWVRGRINMPSYDKSGSNNPRAKKVEIDGIVYSCLKEAWEREYNRIPYSTLKGLARKSGKSKKYNLKIRYL